MRPLALLRVAPSLVLAAALASSGCGNAATSPSAEPSSSAARAAPSATTAEGPSTSSAPAEAVAPTLKPGDTAPAFKLKGSDGKDHALADSANKEAVVLAWFPKA